MRYPLLKLFPFFIAGIVSYFAGNFYLLCAAEAALFLILYRKKLYYTILFCCIFSVLGVLCAKANHFNFNSKYEFLKSKNEYEGYIVEKNNNVLILKNYKENYKLKIYLYSQRDIKPGDYIKFSGVIRENQRNSERFLYSKGINGIISLSDKDININSSKSFRMIPTKIKYKIINGYLNIDEEGGGFISGLVFGYNNETKNEDIFRELGISHILAVSGFNIGIIYYFIRRALIKTSAKLRYLLCFIICFLYTFLSGFEPSITRAFIMISLYIISRAINKPYEQINIIFVSAFLMLLYNTYYVFNLGFILSYTAVLGLILFKHKFSDAISIKNQRVKEDAAIALSAFTATFPIAIYISGFFSIITVLVNIIIGPMVSVITVIGFSLSFLYLITSIKYFLFPAAFLGKMFMELIKFINKANIMVYPGRPNFMFIIAYYILMILIFDVFDIKMSLIQKKYTYSLLILVMSISLIKYSPYLKIHFINVGQGDSIFIETPERNGILIDTGPEFEGYAAAKDKVVPYIRRCGYRSIDGLIITHFHSDHCGGYKYIKNELNTDSLYTFSNSKDKNFNEIKYGDILKINDIQIKALAPENSIISNNSENEICLVLEVSYKNFNMLLTSDAEKNVLDGITGEFDIYKVSHHGSYASFSESAIDNSKIGTAVISVGRNSFGHPSYKVIESLNERNIPVYRTGINGDITVISDGYKYSVLLR